MVESKIFWASKLFMKAVTIVKMTTKIDEMIRGTSIITRYLFT